ncbi:hypothetical protein FisN_3Lh120 [Fistulifera solaris]|uniref:ERCC4 domain-containing protein n=1 Tax=Fistulifera solaris TaxID=1519565 RepID=A0A1Z5KUH3_FISSO|nr:hypothetical protein FisN_3Lh120 [Fistulifera solaris]|eukprot:GAX29628.1 hypothetical protein FisN_3Lh120 [Fistulifera solaris]
MSSDDDSSDDRHLCSGGLSKLSRDKQNGTVIQRPPIRAKLAYDSSDSNNEIVVMPPMKSAISSVLTSGPRLTATGSNTRDPVNMADDESSSSSSSSSDDSTSPFKSTLAQRLARRNEAEKLTSNAAQSNVKLKDSEKSNPSNRSSNPVRKENAHSSQETTYSIENKVGRLNMANSRPENLPSPASSSDESIRLMTISNGQRAIENTTKYTSLNSDSDSDDSLLASSQLRNNKPASRTAPRKNPILAKKPSVKAQQKELAKEMREQVRRDKQLAKEMEKDLRHQQRIAKQAAAQAEKDDRKRRRIESEQTRGKRAIDELAILMEHSLCHHQELTLRNDLQETGFLVDSYPSGLGGDVVQFIRCDYVFGGGARAVEMLKQSKREEYQHLPIVGVVFHDPMNFISKIERDAHDEDDDYPKLESFLKGLEVGWRAAWRVGAEQRPRFIFYLNNVHATLDQLWVKSRRKDQSMKAPPTGEELQDALIWLSIQFCVDCIHYLCPEDLSTQITKMAVWLAREPYQRQMTDLECAKKTKMLCSDMDPPLVRSQDCWRRQLCQVPGISETMASSVVSYFPTMRSLYLRYQDTSLTEDQKILLLADCFGREGRRDVKCSDAVYRILTSKNPNELI